MTTNVMIQGVPRTGTTIVLDILRYSSRIDNVFPETVPPEDLQNIEGSWVWKRPYNCLDTEKLWPQLDWCNWIFMVRDIRDCIVSWFYYPDPNRTLLMPDGYRGLSGYIRLWCDYSAWVRDNGAKYGMIIHLEDLITDKHHVIRELLAWLHIPYEQAIADFVEKYVQDTKIENPHRNWTSPKNKKVRAYEDEPALMHGVNLTECIPYLEAFGYDVSGILQPEQRTGA